MAAKNGSRSSTLNETPALRPRPLAPGKRAKIAATPGYGACLVLAPEEVDEKGNPIMVVTLRVSSDAGEVTFTPRGAGTLVIDAPAGMRATDARLKKLVQGATKAKGGRPPPVKDRT
jgi:hypothetical protein